MTKGGTNEKEREKIQIKDYKKNFTNLPSVNDSRSEVGRR